MSNMSLAYLPNCIQICWLQRTWSHLNQSLSLSLWPLPHCSSLFFRHEPWAKVAIVRNDLHGNTHHGDRQSSRPLPHQRHSSSQWEHRFPVRSLRICRCSPQTGQAGGGTQRWVCPLDCPLLYLSFSPPLSSSLHTCSQTLTCAFNTQQIYTLLQPLTLNRFKSFSHLSVMHPSTFSLPCIFSILSAQLVLYGSWAVSVEGYLNVCACSFSSTFVSQTNPSVKDQCSSTISCASWCLNFSRYHMSCAERSNLCALLLPAKKVWLSFFGTTENCTFVLHLQWFCS